MDLLLQPQTLFINDSAIFQFSEKTVALQFLASPRLRSAIERLGFTIVETDTSKAQILVSLDLDRIQPQSYSVKGDCNFVRLRARCEAGAFYGIQTINRIQSSNDGASSVFSIEDWPELETRGYMLDVSRCKVPKTETLFQLIDSLAALRFNQFQLYTEHTFAYSDHSVVWKNASPLTAKEIQDIDRYCADRFIEFVPNQNSFGHLERWLRHDEYKRLAECPDGYTHPLKGELDHGGTLKPNQESLEFIESLYDELLHNFTSTQINIGCDETWELGHGWSAPRVKKTSKRTVYLDFLLKLNDAARARGRTIQYWGDIILESPELIPQLPKNGIGLIWGYESGHPFQSQCATFKKAGMPYLVCPGTSSWNTIGGRFENAKSNIEDAIRNAIDFSANGFLLTDWGDDGHHHASFVSLPSIARAASLAWNNQAPSDASTRKILKDRLLPTTNNNEDFASLIEQIGRLPDVFDHKPHNCSPLNKILFADRNACLEFLKSISENELKTSQNRIASISENLALTSDSVLKDDIKLSLDLLDFAADKALTLIQGHNFPNEGSSKTITELEKRFRQQWLQHNRIGGLDESAARLLANNRL